MVKIGHIGGLSIEKGSINSPIPISDFEAPNMRAGKTVQLSLKAKRVQKEDTHNMVGLVPLKFHGLIGHLHVHIYHSEILAPQLHIDQQQLNL